MRTTLHTQLYCKYERMYSLEQNTSMYNLKDFNLG